MIEILTCRPGEELPAAIQEEIKESLERTEVLIRRGWELALSSAMVELRSKNLHEAVDAISDLKYEGCGK